MSDVPFPSLPAEWEPTRATLHAYARALGALPQAHLPHHPRWWHISLKVRPAGLAIDNIALPGGGLLGGRLDLREHRVVLETSSGSLAEYPFDAGLTGTEMAEALIADLARVGLVADYVRKDFEDGAPTTYDRDAGTVYWRALTNASNVFEAHRAAIGGDVGPVQFWPHGFDLAFEWFGTRLVDGEEGVLPAQLNLGFYSTGTPYFYSNPWPFDRALLDLPAPGRGEWTTEGFEGSRLDYGLVADRADGDAIVSAYAMAVFEAARDSLITG